jgi:hypothetical protein
MAMTYTSLIAPKGQSGSIANWVGYSKLDIPTILDEAQSLIYGILRVREMRTEWTFGLSVGQSSIALPSRFLDPIGRLYDVTNAMWLGHRLESDILASRSYTPIVGSFGANPFTTTTGLSTVKVFKSAHGFNEGSTITIAAAAAVDVFTLNGTYPVTSIVDADNFLIDTVDSVAVTTATGGGALATYTANNLVAGAPSQWSVWNERFMFDTAHDTATAYKQLYYRTPPLLSASNPSNFLTVRYPKLIRLATQSSAADFMKDDGEYAKSFGALTTLIQSIAVEQDFLYRGADIEVDIP